MATSSSGSSLMPSSSSTSWQVCLHDLRARVVVFVDAVAEAHQPEGIVLVLRALDEFGDAVDVCRSRAASCSAASLAPPWAGPHRQAMPAAMQANGLAPVEPARRTVEVEAFCSWSACRMKMRSIAWASDRIDLVVLARHREAHVQEVLGVAQIVLRIDERLADRIFVGHRGDRRHFGDHADRRRSCAGADRRCRVKS